MNFNNLNWQPPISYSEPNNDERVLVTGTFMLRKKRTGKWVDVETSEHRGLSIISMRCNQCGRYAYLVLPKGTKCFYDYCPWCKARMESDTE